MVNELEMQFALVDEVSLTGMTEPSFLMPLVRVGLAVGDIELTSDVEYPDQRSVDHRRV